MKLVNSFLGTLEVLPTDAVLATEGCLMDFGIRRTGCDAAEHHLFHSEGIGTTEYGSDIVERPHIVENDGEGQLPGFLELVDGQPVHLYGA